MKEKAYVCDATFTVSANSDYNLQSFSIGKQRTNLFVSVTVPRKVIDVLSPSVLCGAINVPSSWQSIDRDIIN